MYSVLIKHFVGQLVPMILPELLREISSSIEQGRGYTVTPEKVIAIMDANPAAVKFVAAAAVSKAGTGDRS